MFREPPHQEIHYNLTGKTVSFMALGDQGTGNYRQYKVARAMKGLAGHKNSDFVMLLGDNFYRYGVQSNEDAQWLYKFENMYRGEAFDHVPFYAVLGNHDYNGNEQAEFEYSHKRSGSGRWNMPARDYIEYYGETNNAALLKVIYLDTSPQSRAHEDTAHQLSKMLASSQHARWTIVSSHVPLRTGSQHYYDQALVDLIVPVLKEFSVDVYFSGHDHNQQLIRRDGEPLFIVTGTGGKHGDPMDPGFEPALEFQSSASGFVYSQVTQTTLDMEFYNSTQEQLFSTQIVRGN